MADIYKTKEIETNINERGVNLGNVDVTLYTMDKGSAAFKIYLKREVNYGNEKVYNSVNLYTTDMTPRIDIVASDGSTFANEPVDIVVPESGVIQYIVSDYVIRHAGKMDVYIYLENDKESVQVANFYFYVEEDGVARRLGKEITGGRLEDVVKQVMSGQLMELLSQDYREQLEKEIKSFLQDHNKDFNLKFEDLTRDEKDELMKNLTNQGLADFKIEDSSISNAKLIDGTIQPEKTSFFTKTSTNNLLNLLTLTKDKSFDSSGNIIDAPGYWITDYILLDSTLGEQINITNDEKTSYRVVLYDENKEVVLRTGIVGTTSYIPTNTALVKKYIRISGSRDINTVMINKGSELLPYEEPSKLGDYKLKDELYDKFEFKKDSITTDKLKDESVTTDKVHFINKLESYNLLDLSTVQMNKTFDSKGNISDDQTRWLTDFIEVDGSKNEQINISKDAYRIAEYDENKVFIQRDDILSKDKFIPSESTRYIRVSASRDVNTVMINKGDSLLPLEKNTGNTSVFSPNVKVTPDNEVHFKKSNNIFNKNDVKVGKSLDSSGNIVEDADYVLTNPIKITGASVAMSTDNAVRWAVYDKDGKLLSRSGKIAGSDSLLELSRMTTADYFMLSVHKSIYEEFMVNYGNKVLPYEEFGYKLVSTKKYPITISSDIVPETTAGNTETTTQVINGNVIDLQNTKQIYKDISTSYDAGTSDEIYNTTSKAQIDYIELSTNNANAELELIYIDDKSNEVTVTVTNPSDGEKLPLTLENIVSYGYPNTEFIIYDPKRKTFKIAIKDMRFSNGFKLVAKNNNETSINIGIKLVGRYYV